MAALAMRHWLPQPDRCADANGNARRLLSSQCRLLEAPVPPARQMLQVIMARLYLARICPLLARFVCREASRRRLHACLKATAASARLGLALARFPPWWAHGGMLLVLKLRTNNMLQRATACHEADHGPVRALEACQWMSCHECHARRSCSRQAGSRVAVLHWLRNVLRFSSADRWGSGGTRLHSSTPDRPRESTPAGKLSMIMQAHCD